MYIVRICEQELFYDWLLAENEKGIKGWIPAEVIVYENGI